MRIFLPPLAAPRIRLRRDLKCDERHRYNHHMPLPLVIAYHLVWMGYGWWLANDIRGSMSHCIRNDLLKDLADLHYGRKRIQPSSREL